MIKKDEFIERSLFLIRKMLEELTKEGTLEEMTEKRDMLLKKFMK